MKAMKHRDELPQRGHYNDNHTHPVHPQRHPGTAPNPLHNSSLPRKFISKESLKQNIARWEALLSCSNCGKVQPSLATLWEHAQFDRPVCSICCRDHCTDPTPSQHGLQQPSSFAMPLSELLRCGQPRKRLGSSSTEGHPSREESVRGPALLLESLKLLLEQMERKESSTMEPEESEQGFTKAGNQWRQQERQLEMATKSATNTLTTPPHYASLDPSFFGATMEEPDLQQPPHEKHDQGFRYRKYGGEVYDPIQNLCKRKGPSHYEENQESDGEFDFPESQSQSLSQDQSILERREISSQLASQEHPSQGGQLVGRNIAKDPQLDAYSKITPTTLDGGVQGDVASTDVKAGAAKRSSSSMSPPLENDLDNVKSPSNRQHPPNEALIERNIHHAANDSPKASESTFEDSQRTLESIATQELPQTADFEIWDGTAAARTTRNEALQDQIDANEGKEPPQSIETNVLPQVNDSLPWNAPLPAMSKQQSSHRENARDGGNHFCGTQEPPQSLATQQLPQTCDFEEFWQSQMSQSVPQSIDTRALPQTAEFGFIHSSKLQSGETILSFKTEKRQETHPTAAWGLELSQNLGNDHIDSQVKSINTQMLFCTADFCKDLQDPDTTDGKMSWKGEDDPNFENSHRCSQECNQSMTQENSTSSSRKQWRKDNLDDSMQINTATHVSRAVDSQSTSRRVTPLSVSLSEQAKLGNYLPEIIFHEELSFQDRGLLQSLHDRDTCTFIDMKVGLINMKVISDMVTQRGNKIMIFNSDLLRTACIFSPNQDKSGMITICLQSFQYLLARVMGWKLMSSECLGALQRGATSLEEYSVWGDVQLYMAVFENHSHYLWHESSKWWKSRHLFPSDSSVERRASPEQSLFANLNIVVAKMDAKKETTRILSDWSLMSTFVQNEEGPFQGSEHNYRGLSGDEIEILVRAGGANVLSSISGNNRIIVAIPDTLDDEEAFVKDLVEHGVISNEQSLVEINGASCTTSRISFVYYSWVIDSICADVLAPLGTYRTDFTLDINSQ